MSRKVMKAFIDKYGRLPTERDPDYLEMLAMSKYVITDAPYYKPSKCANCGSTKVDGRKYVNFGLEIDWYGIVYLCTLCLNDVATDAGLFNDIKNELERAYTAFQTVENLKNKGIELHDTVLKAFNELEEFYAGLPLAGNESSPDDSASVSVVEEQPTGPKLNAAKSRAVKSADGSGRKDFPSLAELLEAGK